MRLTCPDSNVRAEPARRHERAPPKVPPWQDTLYALAEDTGGRAIFDSNDLVSGIMQAARAVTSYYLIGYYSANNAKDGRYRRVRVALTNGRSAQLSYRPGYFVEKTFDKFTNADRERQLEEALLVENPITDISIAMEVNYFQLNAAEYFIPVSLKLPGSELVAARRRGERRAILDVIAEVKDEYRVTVQNVRDRLELHLNEQAAGELTAKPVQYETGFTLLPGKYGIKVLVRDGTSGRLGTYVTAFVVPNLEKETARVRISSVVLSSQSE